MTAAARAANAAFFLAVAAYCFLSYSPFAYSQFIKPAVVPALLDFVRLSPILFCLSQLVTLLTLMPRLRSPHQRISAALYVGAAAIVGAVVWIAHPLATIENSWRAPAIGFLALVSPLWLAALDQQLLVRCEPTAVDRVRTLTACMLAAAAVWASYALAVPFRLRTAVGAQLSGAPLLLAIGGAFAIDLFVFTMLALALMAASAMAGEAARRGRLEYRVALTLLGAMTASVLYFLVCAALAFAGPVAGVASIAVGITVAVVWHNMATLRAGDGAPLDALSLFAAPVAGRGNPLATAATFAAAPVLAYWLAAGVAQFDWNFLVQKLGVLLVALAVFAAASAATRGIAAEGRAAPLLAIAPAAVFGLYHGVAAIEPPFAADRYAALDPSFRLLRDARVGHSSETVEYYAYLRANTLVSPQRLRPFDLDFVAPLGPAERTPDIYLLVVDSLRRDYLSPYNAKVTFTPEIGKLAAESFVFDRAFTRYSGTFMAVRSLWLGGLIMHVLQQPEFPRRDTLLKLLDANRYVKLMDMDSIVNEFVPVDDSVVPLGGGRGTMEFDVCSSLGEVQERVAANETKRPIFFWGLPQDVHISAFVNMTVPAGESYPGFYDKAASNLRRADACVGRFIDFLKRSGRFDRSIVMLTADHGDSYGEEGRWGHGNFLYPETLRVPLIVHLPSSLASTVRTDLDRVVFISDLVPTLYALLGYQPRDLGPLYGHPIFADRPAARTEDVLLASSYGPVYGMLRHNGRRLYVVDAMEGRDYAVDMSGDEPLAIEPTPAMTATNRALIRQQIDRLAEQYRYRPTP